MDTKQMTEQELISKAQAGDSEAFAKLYDLYVKRVYGYVFVRVRHKPTAEDITSVTFMKVLEKINTFHGNVSFIAWLFTVARNTLIDHIRRERPNVSIDEYWDLSDAIDVEQEIERKLHAEKLKKILETLDARQKEVIVLRVWDELSHKEIAELLDISENNSKVIFSRAIKQLGTTNVHWVILTITINYLKNI